MCSEISRTFSTSTKMLGAAPSRSAHPRSARPSCGGALIWPRNQTTVGSERHEQALCRITVDPNVMNGRPCIRGMRLTVRRVVEAVALYPDRSELRQEYPELEDDDIRQALEFAAGNLDDEVLMLEAG